MFFTGRRKHDRGVPACGGRLKKLFQDNGILSLKRLNAAAARGIPPDPAATRIFLWWLETPPAPGFMCEGESTGLRPFSRPHSSRLPTHCFPSPAVRLTEHGGGGALSFGPCVLYFLSRLPKTAVQRRRSAGAAESGEIRGSRRRFFSFFFFFFSLSEMNLKHLFWRRLLLSFSFKVLTKKGDCINSSWLKLRESGSAVWDGENGKIKERKK